MLKDPLHKGIMQGKQLVDNNRLLPYLHMGLNSTRLYITTCNMYFIDFELDEKWVKILHKILLFCSKF